MTVVVDAGVAVLATAIRDRLGPAPALPEWPLVSIVVLNRDGAELLRSLLAGLTERTDYPALELILVDNGSSDDSLEFIRRVEAPFPISILANPHNESFSDACNQGAAIASGALLLFLNNDVEPFEPGWLKELVHCLRGSGAAAASTLIEPVADGDSSHGYLVQQRGLRFRRRDDGLLASAFRDRGAEPLGAVLGEDVESAGITAACLLIGRSAFDRVGGFSHGYWYGPEDLDLALKLREAGTPPLCSGRSFLAHRLNSTLNTVSRERRGAWVGGNRSLFMERWGPRVRREYELDRLAGGGLWAEPDSNGDAPPQSDAAEVAALGFCFEAAGPDRDAFDISMPAPLRDLCTALRARGHRCDVLPDAPASLDYDVAVHLRGSRRCLPGPARLDVLWCVSDFDAVTARECARHDLVLTERRDLTDRLRAEGLATEKLATLKGANADALAASLIAAVEARAEEVGLRTRVDFPPRRRWSDAGAWEGEGLRREVFFFDSRGVQLYGSLFAAAEPSRPYGVVACGSWGVEADRTDPLVRSVVLAAARLGGAGMVFHYPGYGDSYGDLESVGLADLRAAAVDAVAEASRRCPGLSWVLAGFMFGAAVAALAQRRAGVATLALVQPAIRPGAYLRGLAERRRPLAPGPSPRELLYPGAAAGMAYGYPVPCRIRECADEADAAVATALADFAGDGAVIRHVEPPAADDLPDRLEQVPVGGAWHFASQNNPKLAAATIEWLDRRTEEGSR